MSEQSYKSAGLYRLSEFKIKSISATSDASTKDAGLDIANLIHTWEIVESIKNASVRGSAKVYDTVGVLQTFPLRGQELVEVTYNDFRDVERVEKFVLYSITDVKPFAQSGDHGIEYTIHFVSYGKYISDKYEIRRCIANGSGVNRTYLPVSEQAEILFRDYYRQNGDGTDKDLYVTDTDGPQKLIIPALKPEDAMHFLSRKSWSSEYKTQEYRFFETREKYYFTCIEDLIAFGQDNTETKYFYSTGEPDVGPEGELLKMQNILAYSFPSYTNSHDAMMKGAFYRQTNELHLSERTEIVSEYEHLQSYPDYVYPDMGETIGFMNTNDFVENYMNKDYRDYVIRDYPGADDAPTARQRPATYYPDIYNNKKAQSYHYDSTRISIKIFGNNTLFPGTTLDIELPIQYTGNEIEESRSGKYMIESVTNSFYEQTYYQDLTLVKGGVLPFNEVST